MLDSADGPNRLGMCWDRSSSWIFSDPDSEAPLHLWELESDNYLHNPDEGDAQPAYSCTPSLFSCAPI